MEDVTAEDRSIEAVPASSPSADSTGQSGAEQKPDEIAQLWTVHVGAQATVKSTKEELRAIRQRLGENLWQAKQQLARPGRNGGWAAFLRSQGNISRSAAESLVRAYEKSVGPQSNALTEQASEPTKADVERLFNSLLPKLRRSLTTRSAHEFLLLFAGAFELPCETLADGQLVLSPERQESPSATAASPTTEQAAADADESNYDVL